jgi:hypothetical protein
VSDAMRFIDMVIIYIALGAPAATLRCFESERQKFRAKVLLGFAIDLLRWPVILASAMQRRRGGSLQLAADKAEARWQEPILLERGSVLAVLNRLFELERSIGLEWDEQLSMQTCEAVEAYVELSIAAVEASEDQKAEAPTLEICRIAGRRGEDLKIAGKCIHRRNSARLVAHQLSVRNDLISEIEILSGMICESCRLRHDAFEIKDTFVTFLGHIIKLMKATGDETGAAAISRCFVEHASASRQDDGVRSLGILERTHALR